MFTFKNGLCPENKSEVYEVCVEKTSKIIGKVYKENGTSLYTGKYHIERNSLSGNPFSIYSMGKTKEEAWNNTVSKTKDFISSLKIELDSF